MLPGFSCIAILSFAFGVVKCFAVLSLDYRTFSQKFLKATLDRKKPRGTFTKTPMLKAQKDFR